MGFQIEKLADDLSFGCVVTGLAHGDLQTAKTRETLRERWIIDGLVIFRGVEVTPEFHVDLSDCFAETIVHPVKEIHHPDNEKLIRLVSNPQGEDEDLIEVDGVVGPEGERRDAQAVDVLHVEAGVGHRRADRMDEHALGGGPRRRVARGREGPHAGEHRLSHAACPPSPTRP